MVGVTKIQYRHYIDTIKMHAWIVVDRIVTSLLLDESMVHNKEEEMWAPSRGSGIPITCTYDGRVLIFMDKIVSPSVYLLNTVGEVLAGSNIYNNQYSRPDALCLGSLINSLNSSALEAILFNLANQDLDWRGPPIEGEWIGDQFKITLWPSYLGLIQPPEELLADTDAW